MSDYGIKVSRAGFPVETAADNQLLYSSSFPTLSVVQEGTLSPGSYYAHNLGYAPVYSYEIYGAVAEFSGNYLYSDTGTILNNTGTFPIRYRIYNRDIRTNYSGSNINTTPATSVPVSQDYGFKVSQPSYDVKTASLINMNSFSGMSLGGNPVRQLIIHQTGFYDGLTNGSTQSISHNLGYPGQFWAFYRRSGGDQYFFRMVSTTGFGAGANINYQATLDSSNITFTNNFGYTIDVAYVLFKDPI